MRYSLKFKATLLTLVITLVVLLAAALESYLDYRDTETRSFATVADITRVVERQTQDTLSYVDHTLDAAANLLRVSQSVGGVRQPEVWKVLRAYCTSLIGCDSIWIIDATGKVITQTKDIDADIVDLSSKQFFQETKEVGRRYIDVASVSSFRGQPILFNVSKPVYDAAGNLLAIIAVAMETSRLTSFYSLFGSFVEPTIGVYKGDGGLVARNPDMANYVGRSNSKSQVFTTLLRQAPFGNYDLLSATDGKRRLGAYRSIPELDLVVSADVDRQLAFMLWRAHTTRRLVVVAGVLLLIWSALLAAYRTIAEHSLLKQENTYLDNLASRDALTGIGNRRLFENTLWRDWTKHVRSGSPLSLVLIDVDSFKQYNDHYGHQAGDRCLRQLAHTLEKCLQRREDFVARYGGEEFVAVLGCECKAAVLIAENLRYEIEALQIPHDYTDVSKVVTASFGVASTESTYVHSADDLIAAADAALYTAKANGRNQVVAAALNLDDSEKLRA
jgi:diguanylate cyclase (GGDEF)-like protein